MPRSHPIIPILYEKVSEIGKEKNSVSELTFDSKVYISALIQTSNSYKSYKIPNTEEEVRLYWIDDKYDEIEDTYILHKYRSNISFVYDNGIRSVDSSGSATYEEDVEDMLYIKVDSLIPIEYQFHTIQKTVTRITPHINAITAYGYDVMSQSGLSELVFSRVIGYKINDVDTVISPLSTDWKSYQLLGNLFHPQINV